MTFHFPEEVDTNILTIEANDPILKILQQYADEVKAENQLAEKMAKDAEAHAEEDKKLRESIEAKNHLDSSIYQAEKMKDDNKDKLSEEDAKALDEAIEEAKKVVIDDKADKDALEAAAKALVDKTMPIGAKMYEEAAKAEGAKEGEEKSEDDKKEEPVEGEVVDEEK